LQIYYYLIINILLDFISAECEFLMKFESEVYQSLKKIRKTVSQSKKNEDENQNDMKIEQKNEKKRENEEKEENEKRNEKKKENEEEKENEKRDEKQNVNKILFNELLLLNIEETDYLLTK